MLSENWPQHGNACGDRLRHTSSRQVSEIDVEVKTKSLSSLFCFDYVHSGSR